MDPFLVTCMFALVRPWRTAQVFDSVVEQVGALLGVPLRVDDSIMGAHQPPEALQAVRSHLLGTPLPPSCTRL